MLIIGQIYIFVFIHKYWIYFFMTGFFPMLVFQDILKGFSLWFYGWFKMPSELVN